MMNSTVLAIITIIAAVISTGWVLDSNTELRWEKSRPLTWDDFRGIPNIWAIGGYGAVIKPDVKHQTLYEWEIIQGSCHFWFTKVEGIAYVSKIESWVRPDAKNFWGLQHEQIHFDIAEIFAKKFNKNVENELLNRVFLCPGRSDSWSESKIKIAADAEATIVLNQIREEMSWMQKAYDEQTIHGLNYDEQKRWEYMVGDMLNN